LDKTQDSDREKWEFYHSKYTATDGIIPYNRTTEEILTDIWHNQATIIKWLSKIAENTK